MSFFGIFGKKPEDLGQLIEEQNYRKISMNKAFIEEIIEKGKTDEKYFRALFWLTDVDLGVFEGELKPLMKETLKEIMKSGKSFALHSISDQRIELPPKEKIDLLLDGIKRGALEIECVSYEHYQQMCRQDPEARETLIRFYLARVEEKINERKAQPFADYGGDQEMENIIKYLQETPVSEIQGFLRRNSLHFRFSERGGKCASQ